MIKINLTPYEELENPYWWIPDLSALVLVAAISFGGVYYYISSVENEIANREAEKQRIIEETAGMQADVTKFNDLNTKIAALDNRKNALKRITESKLVRYLPVILLENIQNLKPDKIWLTSLAFVDKKKPESASPEQAPQTPPPEGTPVEAAAIAAQNSDEFPVNIELSGSAVDNVAIADFMMALKATQNQSFERSDLRTQLFFHDVGISFSQISTEKTEESPSQDIVNFKLILGFKEKEESATEGNGNFSQFIDDFRRTGRASMQ